MSFIDSELCDRISALSDAMRDHDPDTYHTLKNPWRIASRMLRKQAQQDGAARCLVG